MSLDLLSRLGLYCPPERPSAPVNHKFTPNDRENFKAMAADLGNYAPAESFTKPPADPNSPSAKIKAWTRAIRAARAEAQAATPPFVSRLSPGPQVHCREPISPISCDDEVVEKPKSLFTWDEIHNESVSYIPPLVLGLEDVVGERCISPGADGYFYYDSNVKKLKQTITRRSISRSTHDITLDDPIFFKQHAVRVFEEVAAVVGVVNEPSYKYIGDYYVYRTEDYMPADMWNKLRSEVKDKVVSRFTEEYYSRVDSYRRRENMWSEPQIRQLFDKGGILPHVILLLACNAEPTFLERLPTPPLPVSRWNDIPGVNHAFSFESSLYSQESAPREEQEPRSRFSVSTQGSFEFQNPDEPRSRFSVSTQGTAERGLYEDSGDASTITDARSLWITDDEDHQHPEIIDHNINPIQSNFQFVAVNPNSLYNENDSSSSSDGDEDEYTTNANSDTDQYEDAMEHSVCANQIEDVDADISNEDEDEDCTSDHTIRVYYPHPRSPSDPAHPINARTPLRRHAFIVAEMMSAPFEQMQRFRERLRDTAEQGSARQGILESLEGSLSRRTGANRSPLVYAFAGEEDSDEEGDDEAEPPTMRPWFVGLDNDA